MNFASFKRCPLGKCVSGDGRRETIPFNSMEVNFDSSQLAIDGRPSQAWTPPPAPLPGRCGARGAEPSWPGRTRGLQKLFSSNEPPISNANTSKARFTTWLPLAIAR